MYEHKHLMTITELAAREGVSRPTVYQWSRMEGFPIVRLGPNARLRVPVALFDDWIAQQAEKGRDAG